MVPRFNASLNLGVAGQTVELGTSKSGKRLLSALILSYGPPGSSIWNESTQASYVILGRYFLHMQANQYTIFGCGNAFNDNFQSHWELILLRRVCIGSLTAPTEQGLLRKSVSCSDHRMQPPLNRSSHCRGFNIFARQMRSISGQRTLKDGERLTVYHNGQLQ